MNWTDITDDGRTYCMKHLHGFIQRYDIAGQEVAITFNFGLHVFTDDKGNGRPIVFRQRATTRAASKTISAYEVDSWGRSTLPKGPLYNLRYVLEMRNTRRKIGK